MALTNIQKAAIYLKFIDPELAMEVFMKLEKTIANALSEEMGRLNAVSDEDKKAVFEEYAALVGGGQTAGAGAPASGETSKKESAAAPQNGMSPEIVKRVGIEKIVEMVRDEHPGTIGIVLSSLDPQSAANVLSLLPDETQTAAVRSMALDVTAPEIKEEVREFFNKSISLLTKASAGGAKGKGAELTADVLSYIDIKKSGPILEEIKKKDEKLVNKIEGLMFTFETIFFKINDDLAIQKALRNIDRKDLALALRKSNEETKARVFKNMSKAAAEMVQEDLQIMGPQKLSLVKEAQRRVVNVLLALEKEGIVSFKKGNNKEEEDLV